jgi:hypothetical protein
LHGKQVCNGHVEKSRIKARQSMDMKTEPFGDWGEIWLLQWIRCRRLDGCTVFLFPNKSFLLVGMFHDDDLREKDDDA